MRTGDPALEFFHIAVVARLRILFVPAAAAGAPTSPRSEVFNVGIHRTLALLFGSARNRLQQATYASIHDFVCHRVVRFEFGLEEELGAGFEHRSELRPHGRKDDRHRHREHAKSNRRRPPTANRTAEIAWRSYPNRGEL
jgi:hypothetical protein